MSALMFFVPRSPLARALCATAAEPKLRHGERRRNPLRRGGWRGAGEKIDPRPRGSDQSRAASRPSTIPE